MKLKRITIIGVGLIGGSIGLAIRKKGLASKVVGVTAHRSTLKKALRRKAISSGALDAKKAVLGSDMVILATPVDKVLSTLRKIKPCLKKGCVVIDVASVKGAIVRPAETILGKKGYFVGTHPMAGSEQKGIDKANSSLFKDALCILARTGRTSAKSLRLVSDFWKAMGSKVRVLSPSEHDKKISNISHLPHIAASALSLAAKLSSLEFASTGFKDTTRIAAGDPGLWISIFMANRGNVTADIEDYLKKMRYIKNLIARGKAGKLRRTLSTAKKKRDRLNAG